MAGQMPVGSRLTRRQWDGVLALLLLGRSEEHTSELQSRQYLVCRLLLEKKNKLRLTFSLSLFLTRLYSPFATSSLLHTIKSFFHPASPLCSLTLFHAPSHTSPLTMSLIV